MTLFYTWQCTMSIWEISFAHTAKCLLSTTTVCTHPCAISSPFPQRMQRYIQDPNMQIENSHCSQSQYKPHVHETITWPGPGALTVFNTAFGHAVHEEPTEPPLCNPAWNSLFHLCCVMLQELQLLFCSGLGIPASQMSAGPLSHGNASTGCF